MKLLSRHDLEKLPTKRILAYKNSIMKARESKSEDGSIKEITKSSLEWQTAYRDVKEILAQREHVIKPL
jgi:hypothetical protein